MKTATSNEFVNAAYTSVWEDGTELTNKCRLDLINARVDNIEDSDDDSDHGCLVNEYVEFFNQNTKKIERIEQDDLLFEYKGD